VTELSIPFKARGLDGTINVRLRANTDPVRTGHGLVAPDADLDTFRGFPICTATLTYAGEGLHAWFGWIQIITVAGDAMVDLADIVPGPFYTYGYLPTFFDAPANPHHPDCEWRADTFLVQVPDVARTRRAEVVAGFSWGYRLRQRQPEPSALDGLQAAGWAGHRDLLAAEYPDWQFI
jgi:hypothetical protein